VLSEVFRGKFLEALEECFRNGKLTFCGDVQDLAYPPRFQRLLAQLSRKKWVVYAKPPFGGAQHVLQYLARYTHRVAISNHRLAGFAGNQVTFRWKDYAHGNKARKMTVSADEFLRRFLLHVLPGGFTRIRYFGFLANRCRAVSLELCRKLLGQSEAVEPEPVGSLKVPATWPCPRCSQAMIFVERLSAAQALRYLNTAVGFNSS
jgi:putative transposase